MQLNFFKLICFLYLMYLMVNESHGTPIQEKSPHKHKHSRNESSKQCLQPSEDEMMKLLAREYGINIQFILESGEYFPFAQKNNKNKTTKIDTSHLDRFRKQNCSRTESTEWDPDSGKSLCDFYFVNTVRDDMYPYIRKAAVCKCFNCLNMEEHSRDFNIGCQPVYQVKLALKRGACQNGQYEWESVFEKV